VASSQGALLSQDNLKITRENQKPKNTQLPLKNLKNTSDLRYSVIYNVSPYNARRLSLSGRSLL
jgi:hypothetical protein